MRRKRQSSAPHGCISKINALLAKDGDCLQRFLVLKSARHPGIAVATERRDSLHWKRGSTWLLATFCPFCGERLDDESA